MIMRLLVTGMLTLTTAALAQSSSAPLQRVAWKLADFVILGDTAYGVQLLASPNLRSERGRERPATTSLSLDPALAHKWASGVSKIVDSVSRLSPADRTVFETVPLATNLGEGRILVAFDGKGSQGQPFVFVVSGATDSWWVPVSNGELQKLLGAIDSIAKLGRVRFAPVAAAGEVGGPLLICQLDERPKLIDHERMLHPDNFRAQARNARVLVRYIIDTAGVIPAERIEILLSDGRAFSDEAKRALVHSAYQPGRKEGRVVETVVWEWFVFHGSR